MLSIVVPAFREPFLNKTVDSLLENATGEVEVIAVLDGYDPGGPMSVDSRVKIVKLDKNLGMRGTLNAGIAVATGEFLMKIDAHCAVGEGYDQILTADCQENWLMVPRRYHLDEETWTKSTRWPVRDYHYLSFPGTADPSYGYSLQVQNWEKWNDLEIDDTPSFQGSGWVANRKYFMKHIGFYDDRPETYGSFAQDQQETGLKYWLGGGEIKVNKKTWYAHLQKRGYHYKEGTFSHKHKKDSLHIHGNEWGTKHWMNNEEAGMLHKFEWLVEKFWPIPTWPDDWKKKWEESQ